MTFSTKQNKVIFYEKTGCAGNQRQKKVLTSQGIDFEVKSLLDTKWDSKSLSAFFIDLDKDKIVNESAPKIKNKEIDINNLSKDEIISLMCKEPILIKRPLLEIGEEKVCGFDIEKINQILKSKIAPDLEIPTCLSDDKCKNV
jgi:nitrogenase-associated protein